MSQDDEQQSPPQFGAADAEDQGAQAAPPKPATSTPQPAAEVQKLDPLAPHDVQAAPMPGAGTPSGEPDAPTPGSGSPALTTPVSAVTQEPDSTSPGQPEQDAGQRAPDNALPANGPSDTTPTELPPTAAPVGQDPVLPTTTPTPTPAPSGTPFSTAPRRFHGTGTRGEALSRQSEQFEGRFGRMFRTLPAAVHERDDLVKLAQAMIAGAEDRQISEDATNPADNPSIAAGYTYFGQFVDHDITFDPASSLQRQNDPDGLVDYRTPRFDLDNLYGRGPDDQPYLYQPDGIRMRLGRELSGVPSDPQTRDVPRAIAETAAQGQEARALIGDPRNDENLIVSQLHATMLRFHNRVADVLRARAGAEPTFEAVQRTVRFHYQWVILHDFLPKIVGQELVDQLCFESPGERASSTGFGPAGGEAASTDGPHKTLSEKAKLKHFKWRNDPFIPVEFSVAAYRFGHSMVRPSYRLNPTVGPQPILAPDGTGGLSGFHAFIPSWAVDWGLFLPLSGPSPATGPGKVQPSYRIDTVLADPLAQLPHASPEFASLALRNLIRGLTMKLPSGQQVARAMRLPVMSDDELLIGKPPAGSDTAVTLKSIAPAFADNAPLWCYILAEAQHAFKQDPQNSRLGPVGGKIVAEVFVGLLYGDAHSFVRQDPAWQPFAEVMRNGVFDLSALVQAVRAPAS